MKRTHSGRPCGGEVEDMEEENHSKVSAEVEPMSPGKVRKKARMSSPDAQHDKHDRENGKKKKQKVEKEKPKKKKKKSAVEVRDEEKEVKKKAKKVKKVKPATGDEKNQKKKKGKQDEEDKVKKRKRKRTDDEEEVSKEKKKKAKKVKPNTDDEKKRKDKKEKKVKKVKKNKKRKNVVDEADVRGIVRAITAKPDWQRKLRDAVIVQRWTHEAQQQGATSACITAALERLQRQAESTRKHKKKTKDKEKKKKNEADRTESCSSSSSSDGEEDGEVAEGVLMPGNDAGYFATFNTLYVPRYEASSYDWPEESDYRIEEDYQDEWKPQGDRFEREERDVAYIDGLVPRWLRTRLESELDAIANVPDSQKDFHPGSDGKVQDLIHPSLYPYIRGISYKPGGDENAADRIRQKKKAVISDESNDEKSESEVDEFAWVTGHDPQTERERAMMEREVDEMSAKSIYQWLPAEFAVDKDGRTKVASYINNLDRKAHSMLYEHIADVFSLFIPLFERVLSRSKVKLKNRQLQVIVKAANYVLKPGQQYEGSWHVEGMKHEHIVASGIYYYSVSPNLTSASRGRRGGALAFRDKRDNDVHHRESSQNFSFDLNMGKVDTPEGRCLVFTNNLQHKVKELANDSDKTGVRKILCFFLVDPSIRIISSADIPEQQWDIRKRSLTLAFLLAAAKAGCPRLPPELVSMIMQRAQWGLTHKEALKHRKALMKERKFWVDLNNQLYERPYSFCEH